MPVIPVRPFRTREREKLPQLVGATRRPIQGALFRSRPSHTIRSGELQRPRVELRLQAATLKHRAGEFAGVAGSSAARPRARRKRSHKSARDSNVTGKALVPENGFALIAAPNCLSRPRVF